MGNRYFHTMRVRVMMLGGAMCEGAGEQGSERADEREPMFLPPWQNPRQFIIAQVREGKGKSDSAGGRWPSRLKCRAY